MTAGFSLLVAMAAIVVWAFWPRTWPTVKLLDGRTIDAPMGRITQE
jgi:hypothetical protein